MEESQARKLIIEVGKLLYDRSYVVSSDGNVSIRLDENTVLATPTMTCKGRMTEEGLALTDMSGKPLGPQKASSELAMHLLIYRERCGCADPPLVCVMAVPTGFRRTNRMVRACLRRVACPVTVVPPLKRALAVHRPFRVRTTICDVERHTAAVRLTSVTGEGTRRVRPRVGCPLRSGGLGVGRGPA